MRREKKPGNVEMVKTMLLVPNFFVLVWLGDVPFFLIGEGFEESLHRFVAFHIFHEN